MKCPECSYLNDEDAKFCESCGHPLQRTCGNCGAPLNPAARFCKSCGTPVKPESARNAGLSSFRSSKLASLQQSAPEALQARILAESRKYEGERKPVTILFADIVGSTSLAERLDPEEWKEVVNGAHRRITDIVYRYEGTIAQLLGDGVLAFFGAPLTHEDDPLRAVRAALDIQEAIDQYASEMRGYIDNFEIRVGIHSGTVVVGAVGSDLHMEYLAIGDSVNLAARLQSAAEPASVLISAATARFVSPIFNLQDLGEIQVKGKPEPIQVYQVAGARVTPGSGRGIAGLRSPMAGRREEFNRIQAAIDDLRKNRGGIVFVMGEAGIGKSRLVEEAHLQCEDDPLHWLEGRSLSYGQALPYWPITQLIRDDLGLTDADPDVKVSVALRRRTHELFDQKSGDVLPYLANLLGLDLEPNLAGIIRSLDSETLRHQTLLTLVEYFAAMAREKPTLLVLEDLHWADSSSLETLEALLSLTDQVPILFIFLARIDRKHRSWQMKQRAETDFAHRTTAINLPPLDKKEADFLVENLLEIAQLTQEARELILQRAEGNPFYLEELIRSLIDSGALVKDGPNWRQTREITHLDVPETLQGLLLARIDRLEEGLRDTLQMAAVIGRSFLYRLLSAISKAEHTLDQQLAELQRLDLVHEKARLPELEYMFKHSLTQEAAYETLLIEKRHQFHRKVGEALETLFHDRIDELPGLLAHHFDLAGDTEKSVNYLLKAGDKARLADALDEAIRHYRRAIEHLEEAGKEDLARQTWLKLGIVYSTDFRFEEAYEANEQAFTLQVKLVKEKNGPPVPSFGGTQLRSGSDGWWLDQLDPGKTWSLQIGYIYGNIFEGLARIDDELNLVPVAARSWQVLEGGSRYLIHLKDNLLWTDGQPVTAMDFEFAWKRNMRASDSDYPANLLDDVIGARDYRLGRIDDPEKIGVRALDASTLEVRLQKPVAYFPYLLAHAISFPLPEKVIEQWGDDWWKPEHIVSNGPFKLVRFEAGKGYDLECNRLYHGDFPGNLSQIHHDSTYEYDSRRKDFQSKRLDMTWLWRDQEEAEFIQFAPEQLWDLSVQYAAFYLNPPLDDIRVRKAIVYALESGAARNQGTRGRVTGGIIPMGMPGHSPGIGYPYDLEYAHGLLQEAGYPGGLGVPDLQVGFLGRHQRHYYIDLFKKMAELLGVNINFRFDPEMAISDLNIYIGGWTLDYPDPDGIMRSGGFIENLRSSGWDSSEYDDLVRRASTTPDRTRRMQLYREADNLLVRDQVLIVPLNYGEKRDIIQIVQPWVKGVKNYPVGGWIPLKYLTIDEGERTQSGTE